MTSKLVVAGLTATAAFLLATNPVVVDAAGQITGTQIKNGSLKGKDVKDDSLTGKDVAESTLSTVPSATNATTAGNAATLNGQPPSAYLGSTIRVPVAATASAVSFTKPLPTTIPNGTYLVTINVNANLSAGANGFFCGLYVAPGVGTALMASFGSNYGSTSASSVNAAKVVTVSTPLSIFCATGGGGTLSTPITNYNASEITLTRLDTVTTTAPVTRGSEGGVVSGPAPRP
jgi:hypothetical protein